MTRGGELEERKLCADDVAGFGSLGPEERLRLGRVGGVAFLAGAAFSIPAGLVLQPTPAVTSHALGVIGVLIGIALLFAPWERMSSAWLHVPLVGGIALVAGGVAVFSDDYSFYYVVVGAYAAYVVHDRTVLAGYFLLVTLVLLAPLAYDDENTRNLAHHILVTLPVFWIVAGLVLYLRETLEEREARYRSFAYEAVALARRIRGSRQHANSGDDDKLDSRLDELAAQAEAQRERQG